MFSNNPVSQSMIDAVNKVLGETPQEVKPQPVEQPKNPFAPQILGESDEKVAVHDDEVEDKKLIKKMVDKSCLKKEDTDLDETTHTTKRNPDGSVKSGAVDQFIKGGGKVSTAHYTLDKSAKTKRNPDGSIKKSATAGMKYHPEEMTFADKLKASITENKATGTEEIFTDNNLGEEEMSDKQKAKREKIVMSMKGDEAGLKQRYGKNWKNVMYATATKQAMKEDSSDEWEGEEFKEDVEPLDEMDPITMTAVGVAGGYLASKAYDGVKSLFGKKVIPHTAKRVNSMKRTAAAYKNKNEEFDQLEEASTYKLGRAAAETKDFPIKNKGKTVGNLHFHVSAGKLHHRASNAIGVKYNDWFGHPDQEKMIAAAAAEHEPEARKYFANKLKEEVELDEAATRKDFQMVADLIRANDSHDKRKELAGHHAAIFAQQNPRFDHHKFMKACGVSHEVYGEEVKKSDVPAFLRKMRGDKPLSMKDVKSAPKDSISHKDNLAKARNEEIEVIQDKNGHKTTTDMLKGRVEGGKLNAFKNFKVNLVTSGEESIPNEVDKGADTKEKQKISTNPGPVDIKLDDNLATPPQTYFSDDKQLKSEEVRGELKSIRSKQYKMRDKEVTDFRNKHIPGGLVTSNEEVEHLNEDDFAHAKKQGWSVSQHYHHTKVTHPKHGIVSVDRYGEWMHHPDQDYLGRPKGDLVAHGQFHDLNKHLSSLKEEVEPVEEKVIAGTPGWEKQKKDVTDKSGAVHTPMSRAKDLARQSFKKIKSDLGKNK